MNYLTLPYLDGDTPLHAAFDEMGRRDVRAVVAPVPEQGYRIYMNRDVLTALQQEKSTIADIGTEGGYRAVALDEQASPWPEWFFPFSSTSPEYTIDSVIARGLERFLDDKSATYGILLGDRAPVNGSMVVVVTRHESRGDEITSAGKVCFCDKSYTHECRAGSTCEGTPCEYRDGTYRCR